jgi:hypothetical protein
VPPNEQKLLLYQEINSELTTCTLNLVYGSKFIKIIWLVDWLSMPVPAYKLCTFIIPTVIYLLVIFGQQIHTLTLHRHMPAAI